MEKWVVTAKGADFQGMGEYFSIDPVTVRVIRNRGVVGYEAMEAYLNGNISMLHDPRLMKDMDLAVQILLGKIGNGRKIRIIGDYDIDGVQSTYILLKALESCGALVDIDIPDRITDGYGLNERLVRKAGQDGIDTILTCDNGIAAKDEIALGKSLGMTIIVTDHHEVPYEEREGERIYRVPNADAVVNPKQSDCPYPFKGLCGAGVAYKLVQALYTWLGRKMEEVWEFLPYAAFATVGDVMELTGENRILVKEGLKRMPDMKNPGLHALMRQNNLRPQEIRAYHIGFILGPCLNASGRLDTAVRALNLLRAREEAEALSLAKDLTDLNTGRKELTEKGVMEAKKLAEEAVRQGDKVLVLYLPECHESLAGIIAGRIREYFCRPTFVLTRSEDEVKGSGRSIEEYSMYEELCKIQDIFTKFGGHPMAAGMSLAEGQVPQMRSRLNQLTSLTKEDLIPKVRIDVPMPVDYITPRLVEELALLEPFGKGNERPVFADKNLSILSLRILGKKQNVLRMRVKSGYGTCMDAIYFGDIEKFKKYMVEKYTEKVVQSLFQGEPQKEGRACMDFVYYPQINEFNGTKSLQIVIKNYR